MTSSPASQAGGGPSPGTTRPPAVLHSSMVSIGPSMPSSLQDTRRAANPTTFRQDMARGYTELAGFANVAGHVEPRVVEDREGKIH
jgi:hypothetical protein